jgi:hypothetical protein
MGVFSLVTNGVSVASWDTLKATIKLRRCHACSSGRVLVSPANTDHVIRVALCVRSNFKPPTFLSLDQRVSFGQLNVAATVNVRPAVGIRPTPPACGSDGLVDPCPAHVAAEYDCADDGQFLPCHREQVGLESHLRSLASCCLLCGRRRPRWSHGSTMIDS